MGTRLLFDVLNGLSTWKDIDKDFSIIKRSNIGLIQSQTKNFTSKVLIYLHRPRVLTRS